MKKIGVISDTHIYEGNLPEEVLKIFSDLSVEHIIHAGDIGIISVINELETIAPVTAVSGNMDKGDISIDYPLKQTITIEQVKIGIIHGWGSAGGLFERVIPEFKNERCIIFGHSHHPFNRIVDGKLLFNPGSATDRRYAPYRSIGILEIDKKNIKGKIISLKDVKNIEPEESIII